MLSGRSRVDRIDVTPPAGGTAASTVTDARGRTVELRQYHGAAPTPQTAETGLAGTYVYTNTYNLDGSIKSTDLPGADTDLPDETLTYGYNDLGAPITLDTKYGPEARSYIGGTVYNALGEIDQIDRYFGSGGHVYTAYSREVDTGRLTAIRTDRDTVTPNSLTDTRFTYNPAGNITKITDVASDPADDTQCFTYDHLARLTEAWTPAGGDCAPTPSTALLGGPAAYWNSWQYDAIGNRTKQVAHSASGDSTTDYNYPTSSSTTVRPHAVTTTSGASTGTYSYDDSGNMLTRPTPSAGTQTMTWNADGALEKSSDNTGLTTYIYDADGNRFVRRDPTGHTLYLPGQEIRYDTSTGTTTATRYYSFAGGTIASRTGTALTWLSSDQQGTAQIAVDVGTQQATTRRQTPFGGPRGATMAWPNDKGFVGGTNDNTGLTHLGAREYDAGLGRFISVDPLLDLADPQQWNAYAYAANNPVSSSDPSGLMARDDKGGGAAALTDTVNTSAHSGCGSANACEKHNPVSEGGYGGTKASATKAKATGRRSATGRYFGTLGTNTVDFGSSIVPGGCVAQGVQVCIDQGNPLNALNFALDFVQCGAGNCDDLNVDFDCQNGWTSECNANLTFFVASMAVGGGPGLDAMLTRAAAKGKTARLAHGPCSFAAGTTVLMADGTTKPIEKLELGDEVAATDPVDGTTTGKPVTAWHDDIDLDMADVTVTDGHGHQNVIHTTQNHPFWTETTRQWTRADALQPGDRLASTTGSTAVVRDVHLFQHRAHRFNLTVADIHTYYVLAGNTPVLVHNCGDVALGTRAHGLREFADGNGYTHYLDSPSWQADVRAAVNDPNTRLHVRLDGFHGATPAEKFTNAYRSGMGDNWYATEWEMYKTGLAVRVGNRSWDSITFYDGGKVVNFPQPSFPMPGG
ncbi:RHS repeat-associated protein [Actinoplanes tereljensis]|uniref:Hint domain-containing protein n=1 Tax=Paractinoplanes tereljensis TaxID=571912 RepID=A0A919TW43_9ACTN|nr:polymorphic toxin-type HINT domain-containing protein [Actinoplanes tereljensis]GIF24004.1 hypothetical protein Ate02nite_67340 [Actinoplanes tereljensis]